MTKSPIVISPARIDEPPTSIIEMPIAPRTTVENADTADTPVSDFATFLNSRCAPLAKTSSSRFSAVYALTMRTPPSDSARRPVTSAVIWPRSRKSGRRRLKAVAMPPPNVPRIAIVTSVSVHVLAHLGDRTLGGDAEHLRVRECRAGIDDRRRARRERERRQQLPVSLADHVVHEVFRR